MYRIADLQITGRYFSEGAIYETKADVVEQLVDYHSIDFSGTDDKDNELEIWEYLEFWKINTTQKQLDWVLEYGQWDIEEVKSDCCNSKVKVLKIEDNELYVKTYHLKCNKCGKVFETLG